MAVYQHPRHSELLVAYVWFGTRAPTPAWFDDNDWSFHHRHSKLGRMLFMVWARCRALGIIQLRYIGRAKERTSE